MTPLLFFGVAVVGALGAVCRYSVDTAIKRWAATPGFPWSTMIINISGSFLLGLITGLVVFHGAPSELRVILGTGFCSSYTTFSTAVFEAVALLRQNRWQAAVGTAGGTLVATTVAAGIGLFLGGM